MPGLESFELTVGRGIVRGSLLEPDEVGPESPSGVVLICCDPPGSTADRRELLEAVATSLVSGGFSVARFEPRVDDPDTASDASTLIDDASAVFRRLLLREPSPGHVGVLGAGLGAVVAAGLIGRASQIDRLCLLSPVTGGEAAGRFARSNGAPQLLDPAHVSDAYAKSLAGISLGPRLASLPGATLILHGAADVLAPPTCAGPFVDALEQTHGRVDFELIAMGDHELSDPELRSACLTRIVRFFSHMGDGQPDGRRT